MESRMNKMKREDTELGNLGKDKINCFENHLASATMQIQ